MAAKTPPEPDPEPIRLSDLQQPARTGLVCPDCGCRNFRTPTTRPIPGAVRRYRVCRACGRTLRTRERPE